MPFETLQALAIHGANLELSTGKDSNCMSLALSSNHQHIADWLTANYPNLGKTVISEDKKIFNAAKYGRLYELKALIDAGGQVDCTPFGSQTPAYIAAFYGKIDCLEYLASKHADLNKVEKKGFTPAHAAASEGQFECLKVLHSLGADLTVATKGAADCYTLAKNAENVNQEMLDWLLQTIPALRKRHSGWGIEAQKKIFNAAKHGRLEELKGYIEAGGPIECTPFGSQTPLYIAAFYGKLDCLKYLISKGAKLNAVENYGFSPAHAAASEGRLECLMFLHQSNADLAKSTNKNQTCMSLAKKANHNHVVEFLANNVDAFSHFSNKYWDDKKNLRVLQDVQNGNLSKVQKALEDGANPDCTVHTSNFGDKTPAYIAAANGQLGILSYLGKAGADLNRQCHEPKANSVQMRPCHIATLEGHLDCLKYLHNMGCDLTLQDSEGRNCVSLAQIGAINQPGIMEFLQKHVVNSYRAKQSWALDELKKVFNAAKHGKLDELRNYLDLGAPIDCTPFGSQTPLYIAAFYGKISCLKLLTERGANLNMVEKDGYTPAHAAASEGNLDALKWLYQSGANLEFKTDSGQSCLTLAQKCNHKEVVDWIQTTLNPPESQMNLLQQLQGIMNMKERGLLTEEEFLAAKSKLLGIDYNRAPVQQEGYRGEGAAPAPPSYYDTINVAQPPGYDGPGYSDEEGYGGEAPPAYDELNNY